MIPNNMIHDMQMSMWYIIPYLIKKYLKKLDYQQGYNPNIMNQIPNQNFNINQQYQQPKKERLRVKMTQEEK